MRRIVAALAIAAFALTGIITVAPHANSNPQGENEQVTANGCGVERWPLKIGSDADASLINVTSSTWTSIGRLAALPKPAHIPLTRRLRAVKTTVWRLTATLVQIKQESDSDYHLVIRGTSGAGMIAEIPSPHCDARSRFGAQIAAVRGAVDARYAVTSSWTHPNVTVKISGVGFNDFAHNQTGAARNFVEIHPVLSIAFP